MQQESIHNYLKKFFTRNNCEIIEDSNHHLNIQLTIDMDKKLMNRPFYWHYLEKTGGTPNPMTLTLITNQNNCDDDIKGEVIHFGSPRLHQIFDSTKKLGSFVKMYEETNQIAKIPLNPWLGINYKISYISDKKKDIIVSLGINLVNGKIIDNFQEKINDYYLTPNIPDYSYTLSSLIKPESAVLRLENLIDSIIDNDKHNWANEAKNRWETDLNLLDSFYQDIEETPESYLLEKDALKEQYEPRIDVSVINGGTFFLSSL